MTLTVQKTFVEIASYSTPPSPAITGTARGILAGLQASVRGAGVILGTATGRLPRLTAGASGSEQAAGIASIQLRYDTGKSSSDNVSALSEVIGVAISASLPITVTENGNVLTVVVPDGLGNFGFDYPFLSGVHTLQVSQGGIVTNFTFTLVEPSSWADIRQALIYLLPNGVLWDAKSDPTSNMTAIITPYCRILERAKSIAFSGIENAFPATTNTPVITDWQSLFGLTATGSLASQQAAIVAALIAGGSLSRTYFIQLAASLGYSITITEYVATRMGLCTPSDYILSEFTSFVWLVTAPAAAQSSALQSLFTKYAPVNTLVRFSYV